MTHNLHHPMHLPQLAPSLPFLLSNTSLKGNLMESKIMKLDRLYNYVPVSFCNQAQALPLHVDRTHRIFECQPSR
jgi:hypothetical protein